MRIRFFPGFEPMLGEIDMIYAQVQSRRSSENEILLLHGLNQPCKSRLGTIGNKGQVVLDESIFIIEVFENDELLLRKIDSSILHVIGYIIIDELGGLANPGK